MAKNATIILRVDAETKAGIEAAAKRKGQSMTSFILETAAKAAGLEKPMMTTLLKPKGKGPCPTFFRALCYEAEQGGEGYFSAGFELAGGLASLLPYEEMGDDEWHREIRKLSKLRGNDQKTLEWFSRHLPRCLSLIPNRRREQFLAGVYEAIVQGIPL
jgi:hypothetical protein